MELQRCIFHDTTSHKDIKIKLGFEIYSNICVKLGLSAFIVRLELRFERLTSYVCGVRWVLSSSEEVCRAEVSQLDRKLYLTLASRLGRLRRLYSPRASTLASTPCRPIQYIQFKIPPWERPSSTDACLLSPSEGPLGGGSEVREGGGGRERERERERRRSETPRNETTMYSSGVRVGRQGGISPTFS